jgi:hypothetical protein
MIGLWPGTSSTLPTSFRVCDGSTLDAREYKKLASNCPGLVSGNTITLPDMNNRYPKGTNGTPGGTGGANTNSHTHSMQGHTHHKGGSQPFDTNFNGSTQTGTQHGTGSTGGPSVADTGGPSDTNNEPLFRTFLFVIRVA